MDLGLLSSGWLVVHNYLHETLAGTVDIRAITSNLRFQFLCLVGWFSFI